MMPSEESPIGSPESFPAVSSWLLALLIVIGATSFIRAINGPASLRAWQIFLVNFLFWSGLSQGAAVFLCVLSVTNAKWAQDLKGVAARIVGFLPVSLLFFLVLYYGRETIFPWIANPVTEKAAWLNVRFLFIRDGIGLLLLTAMSLILVLAQSGGSRLFSCFLLLVYTLVYSLLGYDLVMSLDPHWYSTLFGAYFFMSSFYLGLAGLAVIAAISRSCIPGFRGIGSRQFHDLGKLMFGFCMLTGDFFWSQFAVIWYGNIPEETEYVILRGMEKPWAFVAYFVLAAAFAAPFLFLLSRSLKENPRTLALIGILIATGMWFERYLLVVPSVWHQKTLPLGWLELSITLGFFGVFSLAYLSLGRMKQFMPIRVNRLAKEAGLVTVEG